jgi:hypothetical protein
VRVSFSASDAPLFESLAVVEVFCWDFILRIRSLYSVRNARSLLRAKSHHTRSSSMYAAVRSSRLFQHFPFLFKANNFEKEKRGYA